jgi:hypothetical protein
MEIAGCGSIIRQDKDRRQPLYRWTVRCDEARAIAKELHPHLVAKQQQARIVCGLPSNGERADAGWAAMKALHAGIPSDVDFPVPPSCLEPGWYLRSDIIWAKPNPMPESVTDRPTKAHEYLFLLTKSERYAYDADAIREPSVGTDPRNSRDSRTFAGRTQRNDDLEKFGTTRGLVNQSCCHPLGRNKRSVWSVNSEPYTEAHFAVMPTQLVEPCVMAGCPEGGTVIDPFAGSGTVGVVALRHDRNFIGIELNPQYVEMARRRILEDMPMFNSEATA